MCKLMDQLFDLETDKTVQTSLNSKFIALLTRPKLMCPIHRSHEQIPDQIFVINDVTLSCWWSELTNQTKVSFELKCYKNNI